MSYLLDTNIVTAILKKNQKIHQKLGELDILGEKVCLPGMTYYEVKRGLIAANATRQLYDLNELCKKYQVLPSDLDILERATEIHADLKRRETPIGDADISIAATAIARDLILVSHDSDMLRVPGLRLEDWLSTEG
ncbi:MAG: type II toxin-antitoxin system VapC family toxin [Hormoscilla sp. SP5CHS1]|nr:type II toxin-antitoxin system VapC family toxin [Hormoscilla sp. SP12CHS1]MBC6452121.1 type II toxin-antitoxin system VapC family toxin [Hormoscilla sp. SP5CHS1]